MVVKWGSWGDGLCRKKVLSICESKELFDSCWAEPMVGVHGLWKEVLPVSSCILNKALLAMEPHITAGPGVILSSINRKVTTRTHEPMGSYKSRGREWMRSQGQMKASASLSGDYPEALIKDRPVLLVPRCVSPSPPLLSFSDILVGSSMYPDCTPPQTHIVRLRFSATGVSLKATKAT